MHRATSSVVRVVDAVQLVHIEHHGVFGVHLRLHERVLHDANAQIHLRRVLLQPRQ